MRRTWAVGNSNSLQGAKALYRSITSKTYRDLSWSKKKDAQLTLATAPKTHLAALDAMRGIAVLSVCWFHLTNAQFTERFPVYRATGTYGYLGVQIFFVISGFVIPWSLLQADYKLNSFFRFLAKRIIRLDPPYLTSILLVLAGLIVSSAMPGHPPYRVRWPQVLSHVGYLNAFTGMPWFQMSYWSLAVEFQYYIFVGLAFPLLSRRALPWLAIIGIVFGGGVMVLGKRVDFHPHHLPIFLMGIMSFRFKCLRTGLIDLSLGMILAAGMAWSVDGPLEATAGLASVVTILYIDRSTWILDFFGRISYSLYLVHVFVGNFVYGLAARKTGDLGVWKWVLPWAALTLAILSAYVMYRVIEMPSKRWAHRIRYGRR